MINFRKIALAGSAVALIVASLAASTSAASAHGWGGWGYGGWGWGGFGVGAATGLAIAATAAQPAYYGDCYLARQPVYDPYGNFVGYRRVQVCN